MTRVAELLPDLRRRLAPVSASPGLDAELLLAQVLGIARAALAADPDRVLDPPQLAALEGLMARRIAGESLAYLTGRREFWSLELAVTPAVLVPRPETEILVELALAELARTARPSVLDLGTGSGAIALALAHERPDAALTAVDASVDALRVAAANARRLRIANVAWLQGCWYQPLGDARFDCIVSNPPYVAEDDAALEGLRHEPREALVAGADGLAALRVICAGATTRLAPGAALMVEHGATQAAAVRALMARAGLTGITTHRDLAGRERATRGISAS